jgi:hypothetical protein
LVDSVPFRTTWYSVTSTDSALRAGPAPIKCKITATIGNTTLAILFMFTPTHSDLAYLGRLGPLAAK